MFYNGLGPQVSHYEEHYDSIAGDYHEPVIQEGTSLPLTDSSGGKYTLNFAVLCIYFKQA